MPRRPVLIFAGACAAIAAALIVVTVVLVSRPPAGGVPAVGEVVSTGQADVGGPFRLVGQEGRAVDERSRDLNAGKLLGGRDAVRNGHLTVCFQARTAPTGME